MADWHGGNVVLGPEATEEAANAVGYEKVDSHFRVVALPTASRPRAVAMLKAGKLEDGQGLDNAMQKMRHKLPRNQERQ